MLERESLLVPSFSGEPFPPWNDSGPRRDSRPSERVVGGAGPHPTGFTLIELLIVIAIVLITLAGEAAVIRRMIRSTHDAHDIEAASSILSSELAQLRIQGIVATQGVIPLPIPAERLSRIPADASGEVRLIPQGETGLVEAQAVLRWKGAIAPRELSMSTLLSVDSGGKK